MSDITLTTGEESGRTERSCVYIYMYYQYTARKGIAMAIRNIVKEGDPILHKVCRPVEKFDEKLEALIEDMFETMENGEGVGLAGPQVGILRRVFVIDIGEGRLEFVNPRITKATGTQEGSEGCLSCPGEYGITKRPMFVTAVAQNRHGDQFTINAEGLLAKAICHENDHLDGILFKERVIGKVEKIDKK